MMSIDREKFKLIIKIILITAIVCTLLPFADVTWVTDNNAYNTARDLLGDGFTGLSWEFSSESASELEKLMNAGVLNEDVYKKIMGIDMIITEDIVALGSTREAYQYDPVVDRESFSGLEGIFGVEIVGYRVNVIKKLPNYLIIVSLISTICAIIILGNDDLEERSLHLVSGGLSLLSLVLMILAAVLFIPYYKLGDYGDNLIFLPHIGWYIFNICCLASVGLNIFAAFSQKKFQLTFKTE